MALDMLCNSTIPCNSTAPHYNQTFRNIVGLALAISSLMSIVENAIVIIVLIRYKVLHTPSNGILLSLASANFFTGSLVAPLYSLEWLNIISSQSNAVIVTRESLIRIFFGISTMTMAFISYDRYLRIRSLQNYKMGKKFLFAGLTLCWIAPIAISSLYLPVVHFKKLYVEIVSTIFSVTILAAIIIPYGGILFLLRRHTALNGNHLTRLVFIENQRKAGRTVAIIVTIYLLMNGPAIINEVLLYSYEVGMTCALLVMANSSVNPIIYFYQTPTLKVHALRFLGIAKSRDSAGSSVARDAEIMVIVGDDNTLPRNYVMGKRYSSCSVWSTLLKHKTDYFV